MNILFVASEATPFAKTGGLADVIGSLPAALTARGERAAVVLPAYRENVYPTAPREAYRRLWIPLGAGYAVRITHAVARGVDFYFVDCPPLYDRVGIYGHSDDYLRFGVLSMAALGVARYLFLPDIIHCHDWQTGLLPVYLRENFGGDPTYASVKTLFTIHNLGYQGQFGPADLAPLGLNPRWFNPSQLEFFGNLNLLKAGIAWSDRVSTVSPSYAREIQTREYGFGLDGFLAQHGRVEGILNGADYDHWSPEHDPFIARNYSADDLRGKRECKRQLIAEMGLPTDTLERPVIGMVSRFAAQKGFDLIAEVGSRLLAEDAAMTVLGSGETGYQDMFRSLAQTYPRKVGLRVGYDEAISHRIEAGADMFLMPSRYEPCGLNQMYSLRYGTVPVVRATGGLDDTIDETTGFKFRDYAGIALLDAVGLGLKAYRDPGRWTMRMRAGMRKDFSWNASAVEYMRLYRRLKGC